ncbi:MAG: carboxypeptidase regulatory-like domain-containing protein [Acidobacteria bacterium]|nr:carboxypeptidase regulatory-like domain-containing protein [Acidobacteriota bacterium]
MKLVLLLFVSMASVSAQVETSTSIRGLVTDTSGAAVAGMQVTIANTDTGEQRFASTDSSGFYAFPSVAPGTYDVSFSFSGFKRVTVKSRVAQVSQSAQVDVKLELGDVAESVTVSAAGAELVSTTTAEVAGTIVNKLVDNLPLNGRNFFDLAAVMPHASPQNLAGGLSFASIAFNRVIGTGQDSPLFRSSGVFAAGNRDSATNVAVDGVNVQSSVYGQTPPQQPPSSIQEVKIHVSSMNAEFGNGVAAVNVITKSGGNSIRGEVYEYLRNDKTDANYFFANRGGLRRPPLRQNQFGGAVGGPLIRNKVFFFGAYDGFRLRVSTEANQAVPPPALRQGDFSGYRPPGPGGTFLATPTIYNPYRFDSRTGLREPFPGNRIPLGATTLCAPKPACVDPVTLKFLQRWVAAPNTVINGIDVLQGLERTFVRQDQGVGRIDWNRGEKSRVYGRFTNSVSPSYPQRLQSLQGE